MSLSELLKDFIGEYIGLYNGKNEFLGFFPKDGGLISEYMDHVVLSFSVDTLLDTSIPMLSVYIEEVLRYDRP